MRYDAPYPAERIRAKPTVSISFDTLFVHYYYSFIQFIDYAASALCAHAYGRMTITVHSAAFYNLHKIYNVYKYRIIINSFSVWLTMARP